MTSLKVRQKFYDFFKRKGHKILPSVSLISPDPSVLLTTAGMQPFVPYLLGEKDVIKDFGTRHLASIQKCFRTPDIEEVGDDTHHTFFEMLGNWSIGEDPKTGYFKEGAIKLALEFFVNELGLDKRRFWITVFKGEGEIPCDEESKEIWQKYGIPRERIVEFGLEDNFWGPIAQTGPCGPCSEIHYDRGEELGCGSPHCGPNCPRCKRFVELWNLVFMEYNKKEDGTYEKLSQRNVDTGIGLERLVAVLERKSSAYETDLFLPIIKKIKEISGKEYQSYKRWFRIIADHVRGAVFLISDGVLPSNVEAGYILRRILRRGMRVGKKLSLPKNFLLPLAQCVIETYGQVYPNLKSRQAEILTVIQNEEEKFEKTLESGMREANRLLEKGDITGEEAFRLYESYGFPLEMIEEMVAEKGRKLIDKEGFFRAQKKHREVSRVGAERKFGGIGKGASYEAVKLHTATHLLHAALREVLGKHVRQMGSDITSQRLRFDFTHPRKLTKEEIKKVEDLVNEKIKEDLPVIKREMTYEEARKLGALAFFKEKYPQRVTVYLIGDFSKEICAGPHVQRTSELGHFKIIKEESSGAGIRRIKAILE
ncbi:MAG TPA: alanine--tRNA ligase [bacterium]|nr:alanine--tRNA ligase [bacterium]HEX68149.1 alanine--tRNA ligase [bacterium]